MANSYRMTDRDFRLMIQLRAANAAIFTGKKNSACRGWRAISKEMGLLGQVSPRQLKKKWDYLKEKYMVLKFPPAGMENMSKPSSWPWFHLMDQAMTGKLAGKIITPSQMEEDEDLDGSFQTLSPSNMEDDASSLEVLETGSPQDEGPLSEVKVEESPASLNEEEHVYGGSPDWPATLNIIQTLPPPHSDPNTMTTSSSSRTMDQNTELDMKQLEVQREPVPRKVIRNPRMSNSYRMTERDFRMMIQLRAANAAIFTGKKNSARRGWRAISKEMGLLGLVSPRQLKKKWDYLQERYKLLKNPPAGMENMSRPSSWRWFHLMDQALSGKLAGTGKILRPSQMDEDEELNVSLQPLSPSNTEEDASGLEILETGSLQGEDRLMDVTEVKVGDMDVPEDGGDQVYTRCHDWQPALNLDPTLPLHSDGDNMAPTSSFFSPRNMDHETNDLEQKLSELQRERMVLDREQTEFDKELIALEKDRELLNRDMVTVQRERTALDRDRAAVERDRALVERDRAFLERDRAVLEKDRVVLEKEREDLERERTRFRKEREAVAATAMMNGDGSKTVSPKEVLLQTRFFESLRAVDLDPDQLETRQRLLSLFQKLVEKL